MAKLTEEMVHARTRQSNLAAVSKLNCWGSELQDVSLVRRLPNVETLSFSVNKIRSLEDFQHCQKLQHLFVRKNDIRDLNQVCYLRELPCLSTLWLAENPCAGVPGYRLAVIKALPNLEKLDDIPITDGERQEAERIGGYLSHLDTDDRGPISSNSPPVRDVEPIVPAFPDEDTEEHYTTRSNHYAPEYARRYDYSPDISPAHSYIRNSGSSYNQDESRSGHLQLTRAKKQQFSRVKGGGYLPVQSNGYEASYDHNEDDYRPHSAYLSTPPAVIQHRSNKELVDDESPPRSVQQDDDQEELQPRAVLTRSRTESLPRLSRLEAEEPEDYPRSIQMRCRLDSVARGSRQELDEDSSQHRSSLTRSRTVDMLGAQHTGSMSSLHERERDRPRHKHNDVYVPRSLQQPVPSPAHSQRPRNINVLNAVLCLIKELELQDLELVAMSVNCRIDELRV